MIQLTKVTITGADDKTSHHDLLKLSQKYPFVEWGILFSSTKAGTQRYPHLDWLRTLDFLTDQEAPGFKSEALKMSAHFCGAYAREIMNGNFDYLGTYNHLFQRYQINFNFANSPHDIKKLMAHIRQRGGTNHPEFEHKFILQYNKSNKAVIDEILNTYLFDNLNILYDASGGRGTEIKEVQPPFMCPTGYSGGLNPDNVEDFIKSLLAYPSNHKNIWIDMESGVRTDNEFDLVKVEKILEICSRYIHKPEMN